MCLDTLKKFTIPKNKKNIGYQAMLYNPKIKRFQSLYFCAGYRYKLNRVYDSKEIDTLSFNYSPYNGYKNKHKYIFEIYLNKHINGIIKYNQGFHIFLNKKDCIDYIKESSFQAIQLSSFWFLVIVKVKYKKILHYGIQSNKNVIIARYKRILEIVKFY